MPTTPEWLVTWPDIWGGIGGLLVLIGVVWAVRRFVHPIMVRIGLVTDLILGRPDQQGIPGQPSMVQRIDDVRTDVAGVKTEVDKITARVEGIAAQVQPNHGTSAHDAITKRIDGVEAKTDAILAHLGIEPPDIDSGTPGV